MKFLLILIVVAAIVYYFFQPTINSIIEKSTGRYNTEVEITRELSQ